MANQKSISELALHRESIASAAIRKERMHEEKHRMNNKELFLAMANSPHDSKLFKEFQSRFHRYICFVVRKRTANARLKPGIDADDIIQQVYVNLFKNDGRALRALREDKAALGYLGIIANFTVLANVDNRPGSRIPIQDLARKIEMELFGFKPFDGIDIKEEIIDCLKLIIKGRRSGNRDVAMYKLKMSGFDIESIARQYPDIKEKRIADICASVRKDLKECLKIKGIDPLRGR